MKVKWIEIARRGRGMAPPITEATALGWKSGIFKKFTGAPNMRHYRHFDSARWYDEAELQRVIDYLRRREQANPGYLMRLGQKLIKHYFAVKAWVNTTARRDYTNLSNAALAKAFWDFYSRTFYVPLGYCYIFANKFLPDEILPEIMRKEPGLEKQTKYFAILFGLDNLTEIKAEKLSLRRLAKSYRPSNIAIQKHWRQFKHLKRYYYYGSDYTIGDIERRIKQARKKLNEPFETPATIAKKTTEIIKNLKLSRKTVLKIYGAKKLAEASNIFDETFVWCISKMDPLFLEIAARLKLKRSELIYSRGKEITKALTGESPKNLQKHLRERAKNYALIFEDGKVKIYSGREFDKYRKAQLVEQKVSHKLKELRGQGASAGRASGTAKILLDVNEMKKIKRGNILVAPSTYPALVSAMEKSAAIVTNEGGLLSHAAIVSRELGIPCLVGTKIATKVFKDGDMVEVDANKGVVRKINL